MYSKYCRSDCPWDDSVLAKIVAGPSSPLKKNPNGHIELVLGDQQLQYPVIPFIPSFLGLKPSGASHIFLTIDDAREIASANRLPYPNPSVACSGHDFESLSPLFLANSDQLKDILRSLKPKKKGGPTQANRNYPDGSLSLYRGAFEHGRYDEYILNLFVILVIVF